MDVSGILFHIILFEKKLPMKASSHKHREMEKKILNMQKLINLCGG